MPSSPITSWQIEGEEVEEVTEFLFLGSKITVDGDCSHDIKRQLLLSRKAMTKLDCVEKQRHYATDKGLCRGCFNYQESSDTVEVVKQWLKCKFRSQYASV